jgi:hypothetical protein
MILSSGEERSLYRLKSLEWKCLLTLSDSSIHTTSLIQGQHNYSFDFYFLSFLSRNMYLISSPKTMWMICWGLSESTLPGILPNCYSLLSEGVCSGNYIPF